jgi:hypothetical protein
VGDLLMAKAAYRKVRPLTVRQIETICTALRHWQIAPPSDDAQACVEEFCTGVGPLGTSDIDELLWELLNSERVQVCQLTTQPV